MAARQPTARAEDSEMSRGMEWSEGQKAGREARLLTSPHKQGKNTGRYPCVLPP